MPARLYRCRSVCIPVSIVLGVIVASVATILPRGGVVTELTLRLRSAPVSFRRKRRVVARFFGLGRYLFVCRPRVGAFNVVGATSSAFSVWFNRLGLPRGSARSRGGGCRWIVATVSPALWWFVAAAPLVGELSCWPLALSPLFMAHNVAFTTVAHKYFNSTPART